jgi:ankyrin repeat protein|tara:strand:+ start:132 stop:347 length:216 start_codon:yes stop_codon:yes gene_type:complete
LEKLLREKGDTVIHEVVLDNDPNLLEELIRKGYRIFNQSTFDGGSALHRAAEINSIECARILTEQNADLDA